MQVKFSACLATEYPPSCTQGCCKCSQLTAVKLLITRIPAKVTIRALYMSCLVQLNNLQCETASVVLGGYEEE